MLGRHGRVSEYRVSTLGLFGGDVAMMRWKIVRCQILGCAAFVTASTLMAFPAFAQENVRAIGAAIAPPDLVAAYSCTTYAEAVFLPKVKAQATSLLQKRDAKQAALKRLLSEYDSVLDRMCREATVILQRHREKVLDVYARQLPGSTNDIKPFLASPNGNQWSSDNAAFLAATAPLIQYYALVKDVAPELLHDPKAMLDEVTITDVRATSVGMQAALERASLIILLADGGFEKLTPSRFDLMSLKSDELRLRRETATLKDATSFGWFNNNASDLVRMHFNGFDVMREIGLAEVYVKYGHVLEELLRRS